MVFSHWSHFISQNEYFSREPSYIPPPGPPSIMRTEAPSINVIKELRFLAVYETCTFPGESILEMDE